MEKDVNGHGMVTPLWSKTLATLWCQRSGEHQGAAKTKWLPSYAVQCGWDEAVAGSQGHETSWPHLALSRLGVAGARGHPWPRVGQGPRASGEGGLALSAVRRLGRALGAATMATAALPSSSSVKKKGSFMGRRQAQEIGPVNFFKKNNIFLKVFRKLSFFKIVLNKLLFS